MTLTVLPCPDRITETGVYAIPMERYHRDPNLCDGPRMTSSSMSRLLDCPARFWSEAPWNPDAIHSDTPALRLGRAVHTWMLSRDDFDAEFHVLPEGFNAAHTVKMAGAIEMRDHAIAAGKSVISKSNMATIKAIAAALADHPYTGGIMADPRSGRVPEVTFAWRDEETGVWLLSRPDLAPASPHHAIVDLKTQLSVEPRAFSRSARSRNYPLQAHLQYEGYRQITGNPPVNVIWVAVEKTPPYLSEAFFPTPGDWELGRLLCRKACLLFRRCWDTGVWPGYTDAPQPLVDDRWLEGDLENARIEISEMTGPRSAPEADPATLMTAG